MSTKPWDEFAGFVSANFGVELTGEQMERFRTYAAELIECNKKFNLTTLDSENEILYYHFADSLACVRDIAEFTGPNVEAADIGAGAGFPGLPVKIILPEIRMSLIESSKKKCLFLDYVCGKLELRGVKVVRTRAEKLAEDPGFKGRYDLVFCRALAASALARGIVMPLVKKGGRAFFWRAEKDPAEGAHTRIREYSLPGLKKARYITIIRNDTAQG
jgi:16S rRNA (guanine527-N7)-methyltransferase